LSSNEIRAIYEEGVKVSGRYLFRDDFDNLDNWNIVTGSPSVSASILTLPAGGEVRTKRRWIYGYLVAVARSTATSSLQIGFYDGGSDYVIWSSGALRYRSTVDPVEGSTTASVTETSWNVFVILWESDMLMLWVNGSPYGPYLASKIPNKPLPISIRNIGTGDVQVDLVVLYAEPISSWIVSSTGSTSGNISLPVNITSIQTGSNRIGIVLPTARLLATPYTDSTTPLGANSSFIGTSRDTQINSSSPYDHHAFINAHAVSDQPGILIIQESPNNTDWVTVKNTQTEQLVNPDGTAIYVARIERHPVTLRYVRVAYRNGPNTQSMFRLSSRVYSI